MQKRGTYSGKGSSSPRKNGTKKRPSPFARQMKSIPIGRFSTISGNAKPRPSDTGWPWPRLRSISPREETEIPRERQEEVLEEMKRLQAIVGTFEIKAPAGSSVFVDDLERGTAPLSGPLYVAAGIEHDVRITREGATLLARKFRVGGGKNTVIKAEEQAAPPSAEEEPQPIGVEDVPAELPVEESGKPVNLKIVGWSTVGVGAAMLVAGAITGGLVASNAKTLSDNCPEKQCSNPSDKTLKKDGETLALVTDLLLPIGGAVAVAGAIILIVERKKKETNTAHKNNTSLVLLPHLGGLVLEGRF